MKSMAIKFSLPSTRGWAASPDILLYIHEYIRQSDTKLIVEFGSGASTLVIADALRQSGSGKLISIDHSESYAAKTKGYIDREDLNDFVDLRVSNLCRWQGSHIGGECSSWYSLDSLSDVKNVDLIFIDGPPGATCKYARYPAVPALYEKLANNGVVILDDSNRSEESDIVEKWKEAYSMDVEYFEEYEKGMAVMRKKPI